MTDKPKSEPKPTAEPSRVLLRMSYGIMAAAVLPWLAIIWLSLLPTDQLTGPLMKPAIQIAVFGWMALVGVWGYMVKRLAEGYRGRQLMTSSNWLLCASVASTGLIMLLAPLAK
jgi:hypothetical protein